MKCNKCKLEAAPTIAKTITGLGTKPRLVRIRYECPKGHRSDIDKTETSLTSDEIAVWKLTKNH